MNHGWLTRACRWRLALSLGLTHISIAIYRFIILGDLVQGYIFDYGIQDFLRSLSIYCSDLASDLDWSFSFRIQPSPGPFLSLHLPRSFW